MENTSGMGKESVVPAEIRGWNWGAFLLNWIWGIGNNTFIALLVFIPLVNFIMIFVLGIKGNEWAWRNKKWNDIEHFKRVQRKWGLWSVGIYLVVAGLVFLSFVSINSAIKSSEAYQLSIQQIENNTQVQDSIGVPIDTGMVQGSFETSGPTGSASMAFSLEGPKGSGTAYVEAEKESGKWVILQLAVDIDETGERIIIVPQ